MDTESEILSPMFAVFNGHINDADKRARAFMARRCPSYLARIEALEREGGGIMHIFSVYGPQAAIRRYTALVTQFVNESAFLQPQPCGLASLRKE